MHFTNQLLLHQFAVTVVNGQSLNGPGLSLRGEQIPNNGFVSAESIGESDETALLCTTDSDNCCSD